MQKKKISTNSDDEEVIQMDDELTEEVEKIDNKNEPLSQSNQYKGQDKKSVPSQPQISNLPLTPKKVNQIIDLELSDSPDRKNNLSDGNMAQNKNNQVNQHESITLKNKLLNIFTNTGSKNNTPTQQNQVKKREPTLQLEDNLMENKQKKGEIHHFKIDDDNDIDMFEDDLQANQQTPKVDEEYKKNGGNLFENENDFQDQMEVGPNSRKNSEDYISLTENKQQNYELLGKQLTEYESHMQSVSDQQKNQEDSIKTAKQLLNQFDNVKIIKMDNYGQTNMKEIHELNLNIEKGKTINIDEYRLFKGTKQPKKNKGLFGFFTNSVTRYILFYEELIVFYQRNKKNNFTICSATKLSDMFQVYNDKNSPQIRFYFINKKRDQYSMPINKVYNIDNKEQFLVTLRISLNKNGLDFGLK